MKTAQSQPLAAIPRPALSCTAAAISTSLSANVAAIAERLKAAIQD